MVRPRQISDEAILDGARECFLEHGPGVSTVAIAQRLGVSQGVLFQRFGTKNELMLAALAPLERPRWTAQLERGPDQRALPEQLREIADAATDFFEEIVPKVAVLRGAGIEPRSAFRDSDLPAPVVAQRRLATWLRLALSQRRVRPCDPDAVALMFLGALQIRPFLAHVARDIGPEREIYLDHLVENLWRMIAPDSKDAADD